MNIKISEIKDKTIYHFHIDHNLFTPPPFRHPPHILNKHCCQLPWLWIFFGGGGGGVGKLHYGHVQMVNYNEPFQNMIRNRKNPALQTGIEL